MTPVSVKICGVTRLEDALEAARLGADALGFNFWPKSKRHISPARAAAIIEGLPPFVTAVGVFVNPTRAEVLAAARRSGIRVIQLHGDEAPAFCAGLPLPVIKALRVEGTSSLRAMARYDVAALLLDTPTERFGGSGRRFDWSVLRGVPRGRMVLAGGLTPENVASAVRAVTPYAVDVATGVESSPGIKSARKMARFIENAKRASR